MINGQCFDTFDVLVAWWSLIQTRIARAMIATRQSDCVIVVSKPPIPRPITLVCGSTKHSRLTGSDLWNDIIGMDQSCAFFELVSQITLRYDTCLPNMFDAVTCLLSTAPMGIFDKAKKNAIRTQLVLWGS